MANKNRTLATLYENNIQNNIMISGDSHANWVSDLVWLDSHPYDPKTGKGSIGVEFAGSAVSSPSPAGQNISIATSVEASTFLIGANRELQWSELYYRGYYELKISQTKVSAQYFGMPTIITRNPLEISLANFTVLNGENKLHRTNGAVAPGVENGALKFGKTTQTNLTNNTVTAQWTISHFNQEDL